MNNIWFSFDNKRHDTWLNLWWLPQSTINNKSLFFANTALWKFPLLQVCPLNVSSSLICAKPCVVWRRCRGCSCGQGALLRALPWAGDWPWGSAAHAALLQHGTGRLSLRGAVPPLSPHPARGRTALHTGLWNVLHLGMLGCC